MAITRACDYCDRNEVDAGTIQHFVLHPTRRPANVRSLPLRVLDLCRECTDTLTRPAGDEVVEVIAPHVEPESKQPILITDAKGRSRVPRRRNRPGRCESTHNRSGTRCIWDHGHDIPHQAANGQRWDLA
jgi:hypothetical protein